MFKTIEVDGRVTFENLAMFLNLINNVFIPSKNCGKNLSDCEEMENESNDGA